jgi:hypothetical protein
VPRQGNPPADVNSFSDVLRVVSKVLLDSVLLFEHWGTYRAGVPGVYGIGKNDIEHIMAFYQGARQTIYGHGSCGLSFADNHSDLATATPDEVSQPPLNLAVYLVSTGAAHLRWLAELDASLQP